MFVHMLSIARFAQQEKSQGQKCYLAVPGFVLILDFFKRLGHAHLTFHLPDDKLYALFAGMICLSEVLIELAGQGQL